MDKDKSIESAVAAVEHQRHELSIFMDGVGKWFSSHPKLSLPVSPIVHSVKVRLKDPQHLRDKILRKWSDDDPINETNVFEKITDLAGVRVLHLYQEQFRSIHEEILVKVNTSKDWYLPESPKAYTWDPESERFFKELYIRVQLKESFYTSVHYLVRPRKDSHLCCEIQVRTLFEEIWGEVDHSLNYPNPIPSLSCREQLRVLAKVVGAGSRLVDSIFRSAEDAF
jgi:ppGpp synthetase/RelA/SpoT-type nucleotidyltranferase